MKPQTEHGVGIIESIIVISIISVAFASLLGAAVFYFRSGLQSANQVQALFLLDESVEVIRFLRDESYATNIIPLVGTGVFYLTHDASGWQATSTNTQIDSRYSCSMEITEVYRKNTDDTIIPVTAINPKTLDAGTVRLSVSVSWDGNTLEDVTYITDLYEN